MCPREKVTRINKMITPGKINALIIAVKFSLLTIKMNRLQVSVLRLHVCLDLLLLLLFFSKY